MGEFMIVELGEKNVFGPEFKENSPSTFGELRMRLLRHYLHPGIRLR
jgi:hypothetical protein